MLIQKEGPPLILEVYVDGRSTVFVPYPPKVREKVLSSLFEKAIKKGKIENLKPGRYNFNYTKVAVSGIEAELEPID